MLAYGYNTGLKRGLIFDVQAHHSPFSFWSVQFTGEEQNNKQASALRRGTASPWCCFHRNVRWELPDIRNHQGRLGSPMARLDKRSRAMAQGTAHALGD